jgi:Skp family chaperone for outer membrane proteins
MKLTILRKPTRLLVWLLAMGLVWGLLWGTALAKEVKAGYYDLERLQAELPFFQKLKDTFAARDAELEALRGSLYKVYLKFYEENFKQYNKEAAGKSDAEKEQIYERFQTRINNRIKEMNDQLEKKRLENEALKAEDIQATNDRLKELVAQVAAKKKLAVVVERKLVLYGGTDITQEIIKKVKKDEKQDKVQ